MLYFYPLCRLFRFHIFRGLFLGMVAVVQLQQALENLPAGLVAVQMVGMKYATYFRMQNPCVAELFRCASRSVTRVELYEQVGPEPPTSISDSTFSQMALSRIFKKLEMKDLLSPIMRSWTPRTSVYSFESLREHYKATLKKMESNFLIVV